MPIERTIIDFEIIWKKVNDSLTDEEELLLSRWLSESAEHQRYLDSVILYCREGSSFKVNKAETAKAWEILKSKGLKRKNGYWKWMIPFSAAAVTIFLIFNFWPSSKTAKVSTIAANAIEFIKPGSNKATLILDDGSVYDLAASNSLVLTDGGSVIKSEGTKLQYTEKGGSSQAIKYNTLSIPRGGEFSLLLADGTKVWLNSETVLRYPVQFAGNERKVELTGEAFFEVTRNESAPFIVESGGQVIKVLGTEFNISSYKEDPIIYTTLVKGNVEVFIKNKPEINQLLVPNEQSSLDKVGMQISKQKVDPYLYIAWKEGRFVFEDQNLGEIMKTLSKWYNVDVVFAREDLRNIRFTGNLQRYSDFGEVLKKIGKTNEIEFNIKNNQITIK